MKSKERGRICKTKFNKNDRTLQGHFDYNYLLITSIFTDEGHKFADMLKIANLLIKVNVVIKPRIEHSRIQNYQELSRKLIMREIGTFKKDTP